MLNNEMIVHPCKRLSGEITLQGSKNSVLPIMAAAIVNEGVTIIENCPDILDVHVMASLLREYGCIVKYEKHVMNIDAKNACYTELKSENASKMRASILLMSGSLSRFGKFCMKLPGGCAIGKRPIDLHLLALSKLGANAVTQDGLVMATLNTNGFRGNSFYMPFPSVGATQNAIIAACLAKGSTMICNCAREPEIWDLCDYLRMLGNKIYGEKSGMVVVLPNSRPFSCDLRFVLSADRIVAGTIITAVAATTGKVRINNIKTERIKNVLDYIGEVDAGEDFLQINIEKKPYTDWVVSTGPFPEFPTDMQSLFLALMSCSYGMGIIEENVFDTRFQTAFELKKLGADIRIEDRCAYVFGKGALNGGIVSAPDLRGGAALVISGLAAKEPVRVKDCSHIYRGYEDLAGNLNELGAEIVCAG